MGINVDEEIAVLTQKIDECQEMTRDETLDPQTRKEARERIKEYWYKISDLRKQNQKTAEDTSDE